MLKPSMEVIEQRTGSYLPYFSSLFNSLTADISFDSIQGADAIERFSGDGPAGSRGNPSDASADARLYDPVSKRTRPLEEFLCRPGGQGEHTSTGARSWSGRARAIALEPAYRRRVSCSQT
jgi:hypothetical protein